MSHLLQPKSICMESRVLLAIACLTAGSLIAWVIRKFLFEKNWIPVTVHNHLNEQFQNVTTQKAIAEAAFNVLKEEKAQLSDLYGTKCKEVEELKAAVAEKATQEKNVQANLADAKLQHQQLKEELQQKTSELHEVQRAMFDLRAQVKTKQEKLDTQKSELEDLGKKFEDAFKVLAQQILEDKTKRFSEEQEKNLKDILAPLQKEIQQFKEDIDTKHRHESEERISLREQVKHMSTLNQTLSDQANKLAETLRLQVKQQGDWGESILEAILENSGLQKDLQYKTQQSTKNDDGKTIRPDVVVNYPDGRKIIIDSKVSLVSYYNMCNAQNNDEEKSQLKELIKSLKTHIDGLSSKNYGDINQALDFIIMFVPVEPAYISAMHSDPELWQYAYKKGILLISPANLIATLKLVKDMWRKDAVDKNAQEIADKAGKLYDKLVGFVETFEKVGVHLSKASDTWGNAFNQLKVGKGNLLSIGLKLKGLNIQSKKDLPDELANQAILNDHFGIKKKTPDDVQLYE